MSSKSAQILARHDFVIPAKAGMTDSQGNLGLPGVRGTLYRIIAK
jgi:hypothetical protein